MANTCGSDVENEKPDETIKYCWVSLKKTGETKVIPVSEISYKVNGQSKKCTGDFIKKFVKNPNQTTSLRILISSDEKNLTYEKIDVITFGQSIEECQERVKNVESSLGRGCRVMKKKNLNDSSLVTYSPMEKEAKARKEKKTKTPLEAEKEENLKKKKMLLKARQDVAMDVMQNIKDAASRRTVNAKVPLSNKWKNMRTAFIKRSKGKKQKGKKKKPISKDLNADENQIARNETESVNNETDTDSESEDVARSPPSKKRNSNEYEKIANSVDSSTATWKNASDMGPDPNSEAYRMEINVTNSEAERSMEQTDDETAEELLANRKEDEEPEVQKLQKRNGKRERQVGERDARSADKPITKKQDSSCDEQETTYLENNDVKVTNSEAERSMEQTDDETAEELLANREEDEEPEVQKLQKRNGKRKRQVGERDARSADKPITKKQESSCDEQETTYLENNDVKLQLPVQPEQKAGNDEGPRITSTMTLKNPTFRSTKSIIEALSATIAIVHNPESNIEFKKKLQDLVKDTNRKENEERKKVTGNTDEKRDQDDDREQKRVQTKMLSEQTNEISEDLFDYASENEMPTEGKKYTTVPNVPITKELESAELSKEVRQKSVMEPMASTSRGNEQDSEDSIDGEDEINDSSRETVGTTPDKKSELKKLENENAKIRKMITAKKKKCTSIINVEKTKDLKSGESSRRARQKRTIELMNSTSQETKQDLQYSTDMEDEIDSIQKAVEIIRQKDAEIKKLKRKNAKMQKKLETVAKVFNITLREEDEENKQPKTAVEIPEPKEGENTITMFGHSWISETVNTTATFAKDVNNRIAALLRALWPDAKTRIKLVMKKRKGNKINSIVIPEKTLNAIKDMTETLNTRKVVNISNVKTLQDYKRIISNLIKCQRQRYEEQSKNTIRTSS